MYQKETTHIDPNEKQAHEYRFKDGKWLYYSNYYNSWLFSTCSVDWHGENLILLPEHVCEPGQQSEPFEYEPLEIQRNAAAETSNKKHKHYFKDVSQLNEIDVYQVCRLFAVSDESGALHHAIKKLLCSGGRGTKDKRQDITEARDTLNRYLEL